MERENQTPENNEDVADNVVELPNRQFLYNVIRDDFPNTYAAMEKMINNGHAVDFNLEIVEPVFDKSNIKPHVNFVIFFAIGDVNDGQQKFSFVRYTAGMGRDMASFTPESLNEFIEHCLGDYIQNHGLITDEASSKAS